jgi:hypothetical protein
MSSEAAMPTPTARPRPAPDAERQRRLRTCEGGLRARPRARAILAAGPGRPRPGSHVPGRCDPVEPHVGVHAPRACRSRPVQRRPAVAPALVATEIQPAGVATTPSTIARMHGPMDRQLGEQTNNPASCLCHTPCPDCRRGPGGLPGVPARALRAAGDRRFAGQAHVPGAPRTKALFSRGCGATGAGSASAPARAACRAFLRRPASLVLRAASSPLKTWTCPPTWAPVASRSGVRAGPAW